MTGDRPPPGGLSEKAAEALARGRHPSPFQVLGPHASGPRGGWVVRAFVPWAERVTVVTGGSEAPALVPAEQVHPEGLFVAEFPEGPRPDRYRLRVEDAGGRTFDLADPYAFSQAVPEASLSALAEGDFVAARADRILGAHLTELDGVRGTRFAVWAPNAHNVNLMGPFNRWDARAHPMRSRGQAGVWELFVPGITAGTPYKFEIRPRGSDARLPKADPVGFAMELRPATASVVWDLGSYEWNDQEWMARRRSRANGAAAAEPISIYEVHLGSWKRHLHADPGAGVPGWYGYAELAEHLLPYVAELGFTHVELLPVTEYPLDKSWGYQTVGYFAPTSRYGTPDDFKAFVDRAHQLGLGVILDWVPAHFPADAHGLARFDGSHLYEHADPRRGRHPDWGTVIYDYGRRGVSHFLLSSALFWLDEYHIDGLRVDAVASMLYLDYSRGEGEWIPNKFGGRENLEAIAFLKALNDAVHDAAPGALVFAEESTAWPGVSHGTDRGGLGFDFKWNMGWMHDTLEVVGVDPLFRRGVYEKLTFSILYAFSERFLLPLSHDEVVHLKGSLWRKIAGGDEDRLDSLRLLYGYMWAHPGKKLLFMGGELGQRGEWNHEGELEWSLLQDPANEGLRRYVGELNRLYRALPALHALDTRPEGFEWIDCHDRDRTTLSWMRWAPEYTDPVIAVANFTPVAWKGYRVGVPFPGRYRTVLDSSAERWGGGVEPDGAAPIPETLEAIPGELHSRQQYLEVDLPPLAMVWWRPQGP